MIDFDQRAEQDAARAEQEIRRAEVTEQGRFTVDEIQLAQQAAAARTPAYKPSKPEEIKSGISGEEREEWAISLGRLRMDSARAVARFAPRYRRQHAETLTAEVVYLLVRWASHGGGLTKDGSRARTLDLGGLQAAHMARAAGRAEGRRRGSGFGVVRYLAEVERRLAAGTLPRRADWILSETEPRELSPLAWRALRAAVKQAAETRDFVRAAEAAETELPASQLPADAARDFDAEAEAEAHSGNAIAEVDAPRELAEILGCKLDAARAILARANPGISRAEWASEWGVSAEAVKKSLDRGSRAARDRWATSVELLADLDTAVSVWHLRRESEAVLALAALRDAETPQDAAREAAARYLAITRPMAPQRRAILAASRRAYARAGGDYGSEAAARTAYYAPRLIDAAERRARWRAGFATTTIPSRSFIGDTASPTGRAPLTPCARRLTRAERVWSYGLEAATARDARRAE